MAMMISADPVGDCDGTLTGGARLHRGWKESGMQESNRADPRAIFVIVDVCIGKSPIPIRRNSVPHGTRTGLKHNRVDTSCFARQPRCEAAPLRNVCQ